MGLSWSRKEKFEHQPWRFVRDEPESFSQTIFSIFQRIAGLPNFL
jgi:hypothetical protein